MGVARLCPPKSLTNPFPSLSSAWSRRHKLSASRSYRKAAHPFANASLVLQTLAPPAIQSRGIEHARKGRRVLEWLRINEPDTAKWWWFICLRQVMAVAGSATHLAPLKLLLAVRIWICYWSRISADVTRCRRISRYDATDQASIAIRLQVPTPDRSLLGEAVHDGPCVVGKSHGMALLGLPLHMDRRGRPPEALWHRGCDCT